MKPTHEITIYTIIVTLVISLTLIIVAFYYYNIQILHQPASAVIASTLDKFGIREIYPTKSSGEEWFMSMQDPTRDPQFDPQATITKNPDGSYKVTKTTVRMEVYPSTGYHQDKITTLSQKELAAKGYIQSPNAAVRLQSWFDPNNDGKWVKINDFVDSGGWGNQGGYCGGDPDQIITWGGPIATFRWDSAADVDFKNLSVREIGPPQ